MGCEPRIAAKEDELSSRVGLTQVRLDGFSILQRQTADDFRNAAALTGSGEITCIAPLLAEQPRGVTIFPNSALNELGKS